jgi:hypothetical protein
LCKAQVRWQEHYQGNWGISWHSVQRILHSALHASLQDYRDDKEQSLLVATWARHGGGYSPQHAVFDQAYFYLDGAVWAMEHAHQFRKRERIMVKNYCLGYQSSHMIIGPSFIDAAVNSDHYQAMLCNKIFPELTATGLLISTQ